MDIITQHEQQCYLNMLQPVVFRSLIKLSTYYYNISFNIIQHKPEIIVLPSIVCCT